LPQAVGTGAECAGARKVFDLRRRYGRQGKPAADVGRYLDGSNFRRAIAP
jgi:hypothetical protein